MTEANTEPQTFEAKLAALEQIVARLEQGDVPLEEALTQFRSGVKLSQELEKTLQQAEKTVTEMIGQDDQLTPFDPGDAK